MKFQKVIKHIIITIVILLQINSLLLIQCNTIKKSDPGLATASTDVKDTKELVINATELINPFPNSPVLENGNDEMPDSVKTGFYILMSVGFIGLCFIAYKAFRLKMSRAERMYGVQGDRSAQELTPLPIAIDEDSENEDQTIFELNRS